MSRANPLTVSTVPSLRSYVAEWRRAGESIALVPTMGALHAGHIALLQAARAKANRVAVSIFVNPTQFAPTEDFAKYPRDLQADLAKIAAGGGADLVYVPEVAEMYPQGFATKIIPGGPARGLESDARPHFFAGVATVVAKLFLQCRPDFAFFGEKDYQQLLVVKRLAKDLDLGLEVIGVPTIREADGLALSSRNVYLTSDARTVAGSLNRVLASVGHRARSGTSPKQAEAEGAATLLEAGFERVDYVAIRDAENLEQIGDLNRPARVLAAARVGGVRLIDNMVV
jgi:pantoate--beta-alanine ligase